jgi:hypothetical protein
MPNPDAVYKNLCKNDGLPCFVAIRLILCLESIVRTRITLYISMLGLGWCSLLLS